MLHALQEIDLAFKRLHEQYELRKFSAEGDVGRWSYATSRRFDARPQYRNRHGWASGRSTQQPADTKNQYLAEGLNSKGQVVVERTYNSISFYESFFVWSSQLLEVAHFDYGPEKKPIFLLRVECRAEVPVICYSAAIRGLSIERYEWENERLRKVEVHHSPRANDGTFEPPVLHHTDELSYDRNGKLQRIEVQWPATSWRAATQQLVFERRSYGIYRKA